MVARSRFLMCAAAAQVAAAVGMDVNCTSSNSTVLVFEHQYCALGNVKQLSNLGLVGFMACATEGRTIDSTITSAAKCYEICDQDSECAGFHFEPNVDIDEPSGNCVVYSDSSEGEMELSESLRGHCFERLEFVESPSNSDSSLSVAACASKVAQDDDCGTQFVTLYGDCSCVEFGESCSPSVVPDYIQKEGNTHVFQLNREGCKLSKPDQASRNRGRIAKALGTSWIIMFGTVVFLYIFHKVVAYYFASLYDGKKNRLLTNPSFGPTSSFFRARGGSKPHSEGAKTRFMMRAPSIVGLLGFGTKFRQDAAAPVVVEQGVERMGNENSGMPVVAFPGNKFYVASYDLVGGNIRQDLQRQNKSTMLVNLESLSFLELKRLCKSKGVDHSGSKEDILRRLKGGAVASESVSFNVDPVFLIKEPKQSKTSPGPARPKPRKPSHLQDNRRGPLQSISPTL